MQFFVLGQGLDDGCAVYGGPVADLIGHGGADACAGAIEGFADLHGTGADLCEEIFFREFQGIQLVLGLGDEIFPAGQDLAHGTHMGGYVLDAV